MTHTKDEAKAAQPHPELIAELLNPNIPKTEREYAAVREIERLQALAAPVQQDQVCPQKICWTPYECENGRCTGLEKNEPIGRFSGKFRAGDGKMFFEVEVYPEKALPSVFSSIYTTPPAAQPAPVQTVDSASKDAIMGAAYDFRDAHISGSMNLKRSAHALLENAVDAALTTAAQPAPVGGYIKKIEDLIQERDKWKAAATQKGGEA